MRAKITKTVLILLFALLAMPLEGARKKEVIKSRDIRNWKRLYFHYGQTQGYNSYEISGGLSETSSFRSKLEYPHNNSFYGFTFEWRRMHDIKRDLYFTGSLYLNGNYPTDPMLDSDWLTDPPYYDDYLFSYTESDAELNMVETDILFGMELYRYRDLMIFGTGGFLLYSYDYDMYSLDGWQHDVLWGSGYQDSFSVYQDTLVLTYDVEYYGLYAGSRAEFTPGGVFTLGGDVRLSPLMLVTDLDDHVLRNKEAYSDIKGGLYLAGSLDLRLETPTDLLSVFFHARVFGESFSYQGYQSQSWYGDDPASDYDDTGNITHGIPNTIKYNRTGFSIGLGLAF